MTLLQICILLLCLAIYPFVFYLHARVASVQKRRHDQLTGALGAVLKVFKDRIKPPEEEEDSVIAMTPEHDDRALSNLIDKGENLE